MRILRVVGSKLLPCGCFVGLYETYDGPTVQIVEERGLTCVDVRHVPGERIALPGGEPALVAVGGPSAASRSSRSR